MNYFEKFESESFKHLMNFNAGSKEMYLEIKLYGVITVSPLD